MHIKHKHRELWNHYEFDGFFTPSGQKLTAAAAF